jgi:hypothetical protein
LHSHPLKFVMLLDTVKYNIFFFEGKQNQCYSYIFYGCDTIFRYYFSWVYYKVRVIVWIRSTCLLLFFYIAGLQVPSETVTQCGQHFGWNKAPLEIFFCIRFQFLSLRNHLRSVTFQVCILLHYWLFYFHYWTASICFQCLLGCTMKYS